MTADTSGPFFLPGRPEGMEPLQVPRNLREAVLRGTDFLTGFLRKVRHGAENPGPSLARQRQERRFLTMPPERERSGGRGFKCLKPNR